MQGLHLTADLYQCSCDSALMICADTIAQLCRSQTDASGLTLVEDKWVKFPEWQGQPGGVTGAVLLAESHLAIHTWPETGNVTIDVYVCNFSGDNSAKAQALMDGVVAAYAPQEAVRQQLVARRHCHQRRGPVPLGDGAAHGKRRLWFSATPRAAPEHPVPDAGDAGHPQLWPRDAPGRSLHDQRGGRIFLPRVHGPPGGHGPPRSAAGAGDWRRRWRLGRRAAQTQHRAAPGAGRAGRGRHRGEQGPAAARTQRGVGRPRACSCKLATAWPIVDSTTEPL